MAFALALIVTLSACVSGSDAALGTLEPLGSPTASIPTIIPEPTPSPSPTRVPELNALLAPGPTYPLPPRVFFRFGNDLWQYPAGGSATRVTKDLKLGPYTVSADGARVAVVIYAPLNDTGSEEIRVYGPDGAAQGTVYGPTPTSGPGSGAAILDIAWSWDGTAIAVAFNNGTLAAFPAPGAAPPADPVTNETLGTPAGDRAISAPQWAPSNAGLAYLLRRTDGNALVAAPRGRNALPLIDPNDSEGRAVRAFVWLPGRGRLAYVEAPAGPATAPGSIFTVAPDGSARELLLSSGRFAPVASVVALVASPDGQQLAFTVYLPDAAGEFTYESLWIMNIDSGEVTQLPVAPAYRVTDLWWAASGLVWRGVERGARSTGGGTRYSGTEPFVLVQYDPANGQTAIVFQSDLAT